MADDPADGLPWTAEELDGVHPGDVDRESTPIAAAVTALEALATFVDEIGPVLSERERQLLTDTRTLLADVVQAAG